MDRLRGVLAVAELLEHSRKRFLAEAARDVLADEAGLHVRDDDLRLVGRPNEAAVELGDGQELVFLDRGEHGQRNVPARERARAPLLVNGDAFAEPARHEVIRRLEREHVRHLVPQRRAPVEVVVGSARRAVHRDEVAERHAEEPDAGQAGDAHGEIVVIGIQLDDDGLLELEVVTLAVGVDGAIHEIEHVRLEDLRSRPCAAAG